MYRTDWLEKWEVYTPDKVGLVDADSGRSFTYAQMNQMANRLAYFLQNQRGLKKGQRVVVLAQNSAEYVLLFFALAKLGGILVPLNYRLAPRELHTILEDCQPSLLVHESQYTEVVTELQDLVAPQSCLAFDAPQGTTLHSVIYEDVLKPFSPAEPVLPDDPCMILYTAGTTGRPKGAIITHEILFFNSINTTMRLDVTSEDITLIFAPFFHTGGWNVLTTPFFHRGARIILLRKFDPDRALLLMEREKCTILFAVPTMFQMMVNTKTFKQVSLKSVRFIIVGGEPMPIPLIKILHQKGIPVRQGYGLTEVGPNCYSLPEKDAERKIGSIGFPNFYIDARIVDQEGWELGPNQIGELLLRSPVVTPGYWNNPQATAEAIEDGWFHTGDLVRRDEEGYYYVVDRKKDMYISGAENVYPGEVEAFLYTHPKVAEVAVIGVPDEKWGEVGKAFIVLKPGEQCSQEEILEFCSGNLAKYKIPKYVEFVDQLPKSDAGKILKRELKARHKSLS